MVGVPIDPLYVKFRDGLMKANDDVRDALRWRWSPRHGDWFQYSVAEWILDDVAIPDTSPGSSFHLTQEDEERVERARADSFYPDVFARVQQRTPGTRIAGLDWCGAGTEGATGATRCSARRPLRCRLLRRGRGIRLGRSRCRPSARSGSRTSGLMRQRATSPPDRLRR